MSSFDTEIIIPEELKKEEKVNTTLHVVQMQAWEYVPKEITIKKGDSIMWINHDGESHTESGAGFDSGSLLKEDSFSFQFNRVGIYPYGDTFHKPMRGEVIVEE